MSCSRHSVLRVLRVLLLWAGMLPGMAAVTNAQPPVKKYTVKDGKMYIELSKKISQASLDSFVRQFSLEELALQDFIFRNLRDSLALHGWVLEKNTSDLAVISKPMQGFDQIADPAEKILFMGKHYSSGTLFPPVSSQVIFGTNRFRNKNNFRLQDSIVTFFLRNNLRAGNVILSGSFNSWSANAMPMMKTDSGWIKTVRLGPGKYWYKFIVDGNWTTDRDNRISENDGQGNVNSVYFRPNYTIRLDSFTRAKKVLVAGSFNNWNPEELALERSYNGWALPVYLAEGTHTYRFIVDGRWMADPFNEDKVRNEFGEFNSVIRIGNPYIIRLDGYTDAKEVVLTGSFNDWRRNELYMRKTADGWELPYHIGPGNYEYQFIVDGKRLGSPTGSGNLIFIIDPNYTFRLNGFSSAGSVYLAGDFNNWSPNGFAMKKENGEWVLTVHLSPGKHLYKFVVDGNWILDPENKQWEQNEHHTGNSVIWLEQD